MTPNKSSNHNLSHSLLNWNGDHDLKVLWGLNENGCQSALENDDKVYQSIKKYGDAKLAV